MSGQGGPASGPIRQRGGRQSRQQPATSNAAGNRDSISKMSKQGLHMKKGQKRANPHHKRAKRGKK